MRCAQNWSDIIVERKLEWKDGPEGETVLLVPRFRIGRLAKWLQPRLKRKHTHVKLDEIGTFVWSCFDAKNTFEDIVGLMRNRFGEKIEPAEDRLKKFLIVLERGDFVKLYQPQNSVQA